MNAQLDGQLPDSAKLCLDVRQIVYSFMKPRELILLVSKLNSQER